MFQRRADPIEAAGGAVPPPPIRGHGRVWRFLLIILVWFSRIGHGRVWRFLLILLVWSSLVPLVDAPIMDIDTDLRARITRPELLEFEDYGLLTKLLVQRASSPDEVARLTAITLINQFVELGGDKIVPYHADILGAILPCISDKEEKIREVARDTNKKLRAIKSDTAEGFDVGAILSTARRQLSSEWEATRIEALHWISTLLNRRHTEVLTHLNDIFDTLLEALSDPSDQVVLLVLEVHACIAKDPQHFRQLVVFLLEKRCALIIRQHCVLFDAERVYRELSTILGESDQDVASTMMQVQELIQDHDSSSFGDVSLQGPFGTGGL